MKLAAVALMLGVASVNAQDISVTIAGEVAPGVYGQVIIGESYRPPVLYAQPVIIVPGRVEQRPIYLHVPPGHARNWRKHCHRYGACRRPVYFVKSQEYERGYHHGRRGR